MTYDPKQGRADMRAVTKEVLTRRLRRRIKAAGQADIPKPSKAALAR